MVKIIIDTNIWVSFLIGKQLQGLHVLLSENKFQVITCDEQLSELIEVFAKPKLHTYFSFEQVSEFLSLLEEKSLTIKCTTKIDLCRDPKDNYLLGLSLDSGSDLLITGDKDLLILNPFRNTKIMNFKDFETQFLNLNK